MIARTAALFVVWMLVSASLDTAHLVAGLAAALGVAWVNRGSRSPGARPFPVLGVIAYLPWLLVRIMSSGIQLSRIILDPRLPIAPAFIRHRTELSDEAAIVLLGSSITLTPGTVTVDVIDDELIVHAIDGSAADDLTSGKFEAKLSAIFGKKETSS